MFTVLNRTLVRITDPSVGHHRKKTDNLERSPSFECVEYYPWILGGGGNIINLEESATCWKMKSSSGHMWALVLLNLLLEVSGTSARRLGHPAWTHKHVRNLFVFCRNKSAILNPRFPSFRTFAIGERIGKEKYIRQINECVWLDEL